MLTQNIEHYLPSLFPHRNTFYKIHDNISLSCMILCTVHKISTSKDYSTSKEALAVKKASGVKLGRPVGTKVKSKLDGKEDAIKELLEKHIPVASIAKIFGVARTTMVNFIGSRELKNYSQNNK